MGCVFLHDAGLDCRPGAIRTSAAVGDYYSTSPGVDPQGPASGSDRAGRGGYVGNNVLGVRSAVRDGYPQGVRINGVGFRLARRAE